MAVAAATVIPAVSSASTHTIGERDPERDLEPDFERACVRVLKWELDRELLRELEMELLVEEDRDRDFLSDL